MKYDTNWPKEIGDDFGGSGNSEMKTADFADWFDIRFIAQHTETVGKVIYYPFIILAIMIAARLRWFDNWNWPISLITVYVMASIYMLSCAIGLQYHARKMRGKALGNLRAKLDRARLGKTRNRSRSVRRAVKFRYMITEINSLRSGAFRPLTENPIIHAILIPSGGSGLLMLLRLLV